MKPNIHWFIHRLSSCLDRKRACLESSGRVKQAMAYTLIASERSPFARIVRMLMARHGIPFEFRILNFVDDAVAAAELAKETPINKVPILIDGSQKIFDSRVIVNHLTNKHGLPTLTLDEENIVSIVYGCMDTSVILFLMKRNGYDLAADNGFLKRNLARIPTSLEYLTLWASSLDPRKESDWNYASMSLYSYLQWAEVRTDLISVKDYPALHAFMEKFADAPGVKETAMPV